MAMKQDPLEAVNSQIRHMYAVEAAEMQRRALYGAARENLPSKQNPLGRAPWDVQLTPAAEQHRLALLDNIYTTTAQNLIHPIAANTERDRAAAIEKARSEGAALEREQIMLALRMCKPTETAYSRRDWALEERGKRYLWAKIMKALGEPVKEGE